MKKFFIGLLKALGYFGIYLGAQIVVSTVYSIYVVVPVVVKYSLGNYNLMDPVIFEQYMNEITQPVLDATMLLTIISGVLTIGILWLIFVCRKKKVTKELCLRKISGGTAVSVILMGLGFNVLTDVFLSLLPEAWLASYEESSSVAFLGDFWMMVIGVVIMAPIVEEIIFRGLAYTRMKKGMPKVVALLLTAALFGLAHGHPVWMLYTFVFGLALIWVFERTKSLFGSILLHFSYNLCAVLRLLLPEDTPDWVGVAMIAAAVVVTAIGIFWFLKTPKATEPVEELAATEAPAAQTEESVQKEKTVETVETVVETAASVADIAIEVAETVIDNL